MSNNLLNILVKECVLYNPDMSDAEFYIPEGEDRAVVAVMPDSTKYLYDSPTRSIRNLTIKEKHDEEDDSEEYTRREFSLYLDRKMRRHGMTQAALAKASGLSQAIICKYVRGESLPNIHNLWRIEKAFGYKDGEIMRSLRKKM